MNSPVRFRLLLALAALLLVFPPASAQDDADYDDDGIRQTVARISWFDGDVSFNRGDDPDDWQPASVNYPMTVGDRLWAPRDARVELQLRGATVYLAPGSELSALDLTRDVRQLSLTVGTASLWLHRLERDDVFEIATPNVSVTFETPGVYRVDVDQDGNTRVSVRKGRAWAAAAGGQVQAGAGDLVRVWGIDRPDYDVVRLDRADTWDRWVENRVRSLRTVHTVSYVHPDIDGADDLDTYGAWESVPEYGQVWFPTVTVSGWEPYRYGRWIWRDPWGWTWVSSEPWGWAPYHYGRWAVVRSRWCWVPVGPRGPYPTYSPALVGFVGGGPGWSVSVSGGGFVGWFPLAPREPFVPWWHHSRSPRNVADYHFAYRERVTIVRRDSFVRGDRVDRDFVRDKKIVREVSRAPVLHGPIPVLPTRDSIRVREVSVEGRGATRPPERAVRREVVTRTAPPPAPPTFDRKLSVIRESGGEPVPVEVSRRLSVDEHRGERVQPVRPAGRDEVLLAPRGDVGSSRRPEPLPPAGDRPGNRPPSGSRDETRPTQAPELPRESWPMRPTAAPRRVEVPEEARPPRESQPEPRPGWNAVPTRPEANQWPERGEPTRPPRRTFERPEPSPTPRSMRAPMPMPRFEPTEPPREPAPTRTIRQEAPRAEPQVVAPPRGEVRSPSESRPGRGEPEKVEPKKTAPTAKPAPKATETPKPAARRVEPGR